jgi:hypothetical protein
MASRKQGMRHLCSSLVWDLRNEAVRDGKLDPGLAQRLDAFQARRGLKQRTMMPTQQ